MVGISFICYMLLCPKKLVPRLWRIGSPPMWGSTSRCSEAKADGRGLFIVCMLCHHRHNTPCRRIRFSKSVRSRRSSALALSSYSHKTHHRPYRHLATAWLILCFSDKQHHHQYVKYADNKLLNPPVQMGLDWCIV